MSLSVRTLCVTIMVVGSWAAEDLRERYGTRSLEAAEHSHHNSYCGISTASGFAFFV